MTASRSSLLLYTIGHSNHAFDSFVSLLKKHGIEVLVDVRSHPYSRFSPHFCQDTLKAALGELWIGYEFLGRELGGKPEDPRFYDEKGRVLYPLIAETAAFQLGLESLQRSAKLQRTAIMCSEENPSMCHRRHLITKVLLEQGIDVIHIRGDGTIETESDIREREIAPKSDQLDLFGGELV